MKFSIRRTSIWNDEVKPHDKAFKENIVRVDRRVVDDPSKLKRVPDRENWYKLGGNHRVKNGKIEREFVEEGWFIEINSLEELIAFQEEQGDLVLTTSWENEDVLEIEIYDGYRE